jgi:Ser-tRNA(Ala) deacylase AlaX
MRTELSYFEDTYKFEEEASLVTCGKDEKGNFVILDRTLFYPQGGGQPPDQGTIQINEITIPIHFVKMQGDVVRHYTDKNYDALIGQKGLCSIDSARRLYHSRLHSAGHLISNIIEKLYPGWMGVKGHHFPEQCYVEFQSQTNDNPDISIDLINEEIQKLIKEDHKLETDQVPSDTLQKICPNLPYTIPTGRQVRIIKFGDFPFSPCGGTHVKNLRELKGLEITKYKLKGVILKVSYDIPSR